MAELPIVPEDIHKLAEAIEQAESVLVQAIGIVIENHIKERKRASPTEFSLEELLLYLPHTITLSKRYKKEHEYAIAYTRHEPHLWVVTLENMTKYDPTPLHQTQGRTLKEAVIKMAYYLRNNGYIE